MHYNNQYNALVTVLQCTNYSVKHYAYNDRITNDSTAHVHVCTVYGKTA